MLLSPTGWALFRFCKTWREYVVSITSHTQQICSFTPVLLKFNENVEQTRSYATRLLGAYARLWMYNNKGADNSLYEFFVVQSKDVLMNS